MQEKNNKKYFSCKIRGRIIPCGRGGNRHKKNTFVLMCDSPNRIELPHADALTCTSHQFERINLRNCCYKNHLYCTVKVLSNFALIKKNTWTFHVPQPTSDISKWIEKSGVILSTNSIDLAKVVKNNLISFLID